MQYNNLVNIVFEDINTQYGWGKYGDFKVMIRKSDGYMNATKLCHVAGKRFRHWSENKTSDEVLNEVGNSVGIQQSLLVQTVSNGPNETRGSYVHQDLIPLIASWMSPKFAVFVSRIIREWRQHSVQNEAIYWNELESAVKDSSKRESREKELQVEVAERESGIREVSTPNGFIDILTSTRVIEVKTASNWKYAIGQVIVYGLSYPDRERWIYLFDNEQVCKVEIEKVCNKVGVHVKFVTL